MENIRQVFGGGHYVERSTSVTRQAVQGHSVCLWWPNSHTNGKLSLRTSEWNALNAYISVLSHFINLGNNDIIIIEIYYCY